MDMARSISHKICAGVLRPKTRAQVRGDVGADPQSSAAAALRATAATAGVFSGKSLALTRVPYPRRGTSPSWRQTLPHPPA
jgi:hypothetical protein